MTRYTLVVAALSAVFVSAPILFSTPVNTLSSHNQQLSTFAAATTAEYYTSTLPAFYSRLTRSATTLLTNYFTTNTSNTMSATTTTGGSTIKRGASLFLPHGGGPMPLMSDPKDDELTRYLQDKVPGQLGINPAKPEDNPKGIIYVSAHWETSEVSVSIKENNSLFYDYYGFPPEAYNYNLKAKGSKKYGELVAQAFTDAGFLTHVESKRGWDHGVFVPMLCSFPEGLPENVPIIEVSVLASQNPSHLIKQGRALAKFRDQGFAILGSGMSFHNFDAFFSRDPARTKAYIRDNLEFEKQLFEILASDKFKTTNDRLDALKKWESLPGGLASQPKGHADHLSPLLVLAGTSLTDEPAKRVAFPEMMKFKVSAYLFQ